MSRNLKRAPIHKNQWDQKRIEELLAQEAERIRMTSSYTPEHCTNDCLFRQMGFCIKKGDIAPKYDDACYYANKERG